MNRSTKILTSAFIATTFLAAPALAGSDNPHKQEHAAGASGQVTTGVKGAAGGVGAGLGANANGMAKSGATMTENNQGEVVSSIRSANKATTDLSAVTESSEVSVVKVAPASDASAKAIDNAVADNTAAIDNLRTSIEANAMLKQKLEAEGYASSNVIAARTQADGSVTLYVR